MPLFFKRLCSLLVGMALQLDLATRAALIFCAAVVWFAEILNTALDRGDRRGGGYTGMA